MIATNDDASAWPDGEGPLRREAAGQSDGTLIIDLGGFEGPLDLLLELARHRKIDLSPLSMLALAEQYLAFIASARAKRLELAVAYLVTAGWLTYFKSRLQCPVATD